MGGPGTINSLKQLHFYLQAAKGRVQNLDTMKARKAIYDFLKGFPGMTFKEVIDSLPYYSDTKNAQRKRRKRREKSVYQKPTTNPLIKQSKEYLSKSINEGFDKSLNDALGL